MPSSGAVLLTTMLVALVACGGDGATVDTVATSTTADPDEADVRLDPDDIVITDEDLDGDGSPSTVGSTTADGDPSADPDDGDDPATDGSATDDPATDDPATDDPATDGSGDPDGAVPDDATGAGGEGVEFTTSEGVPGDWPVDVPAPVGLIEPASTVLEDAGEYTIVVTGIPAVEATDYVADYLDEVTSSGFETTSVVDDGDQIFSFAAEGEDWFLSAAASGVGGTEEIVVALTRKD